MIIYSCKMFLLLHLSMAASETASPKLASKSPRSVVNLNRNKLEADLYSQVIQIVPPPQTDCYCGKKYPNSISDEINPTNKAEIERFVVYLYVKRENNKRVSYIYLPNAEKQKLMPDFAKSKGDILVKNPNSDEEVTVDLTELNEGRSDSYNIDDTPGAEKEYSNNLLQSIGAGLLLQPQEPTFSLHLNQYKTRPLDSPRNILSRSQNKRNVLQSINSLRDENDEGLENESTGEIRSGLPWLKINENSYLNHEEEKNLLEPVESTIEDYTDENDFPKDINDKYLGQLDKQRDIQLLNPVKPLSGENPWMKKIAGLRIPSESQLFVPSFPGPSSTTLWSWHKGKQPQRLQAVNSMYTKPWFNSIELRPVFGLDSTKTIWQRPKVTENLPSQPQRLYTTKDLVSLTPLTSVSSNPKKLGVHLRPTINYKLGLGLEPLTPIQPSKNQALEPLKIYLNYENNRNWLRPLDAINLKPKLQIDENDNEDSINLALLEEEKQKKNTKPWSINYEEELKELSNRYGLDISKLLKMLYGQKYNYPSAQKSPINSMKELSINPKSNRHHWNLRVVSSFKNKIRKSPAKNQGFQADLYESTSPKNTPLKKNILKKLGPKTRSIQKPKKTKPEISTNPTTDLSIDEEAPKFRIIGGKAAMGSGDPLKTKGRRAVSKN